MHLLLNLLLVMAVTEAPRPGVHSSRAVMLHELIHLLVDCYMILRNVSAIVVSVLKICQLLALSSAGCKGCRDARDISMPINSTYLRLMVLCSV